MIGACPVCGTADSKPVLNLVDLPIAINAQASADQAANVPKGPMALVVCTACAHLYNQSFDPEASQYESSYENSLHYSPTFRGEAEALAARLVADHELTGSDVADVGAGPGHFLTLLCEAGAGSGHGFDPSYDPARLGAPEHPAVTLTSDLFPDDGSQPFKMVMSQHVLEHLVDPVGLLSAMRSSVEPVGGFVYTEVPNGQLMIDACALWDLIYEHFSYFQPSSLHLAAAKAGLSIERTSETFGRQFLSIESLPTDPVHDLPDPAEVANYVAAAVAFGDAARARIADAAKQLAEFKQQGPVALWGAGSKGMTYLNLMAAEFGAAGVDAVIDINPRKVGFGVPGVANVIGEPASLMNVQPATVLVANPIYIEEITAQLAELGLTPNVLALWD